MFLMPSLEIKTKTDDRLKGHQNSGAPAFFERKGSNPKRTFLDTFSNPEEPEESSSESCSKSDQGNSSGNSDPFHESAINSLLKTKIKEESDLEFDLVM